MVWMECSQKNQPFKKMTLKMDFGCESYSLLKKYINGNKRDMWQVEVGPHGNTLASNNLTFTKKFLMK
jgi:hypothetical protein